MRSNRFLRSLPEASGSTPGTTAAGSAPWNPDCAERLDGELPEETLPEHAASSLLLHLTREKLGDFARQLEAAEKQPTLA